MLERFGDAGEERLDVGIVFDRGGHGVDGGDERLRDGFEVGFLEALVGLFAEVVEGVVEDHAGVGLRVEGDGEGGAAVERGLDGRGGNERVGPAMPAGGALGLEFVGDGGGAGVVEGAGFGGGGEERDEMSFCGIFVGEDREVFVDGRVAEFAPGGQDDFGGGCGSALDEGGVVANGVDREEVADAGGEGAERGDDVGVGEQRGGVGFPFVGEGSPGDRAGGGFVFLQVELIEAGFDGGVIVDEGDGVEACAVVGAGALAGEGLVAGIIDLREVVGPLERGVGHEVGESGVTVGRGNFGGDGVAPVGALNGGEAFDVGGDCCVKAGVDCFEGFKFSDVGLVFFILIGLEASGFGGDFVEERRVGFEPLISDDRRGLQERRAGQAGALLGDVFGRVDDVGADPLVAFGGELVEVGFGFGDERFQLGAVFLDG